MGIDGIGLHTQWLFRCRALDKLLGKDFQALPPGFRQMRG